MAVRYEEMTTLIPNTIMQKVFVNEEHTQYTIAAVDGYVLHDKRVDSTIEDDITGETTTILGYRSGRGSIPASYNFDTNPFELYAVPESSVPSDQIFGGGDNNDHEVM